MYSGDFHLSVIFSAGSSAGARIPYIMRCNIRIKQVGTVGTSLQPDHTTRIIMLIQGNHPISHVLCGTLVSIVSILQISPNLAAAGALVYLLQGGARRSPGILRCVAFGLPQIH